MWHLCHSCLKFAMSQNLTFNIKIHITSLIPIQKRNVGPERDRRGQGALGWPGARKGHTAMLGRLAGLPEAGHEPWGGWELVRCPTICPPWI